MQEKIINQTFERPMDSVLNESSALTEIVMPQNDTDCKTIPVGTVEEKQINTENKLEVVKALLENEITDATMAFKPEYIDAVAYAKEHLDSEYFAFKAKAKVAKVSLRDLDKAVTNHLKKIKSADSDALEASLELGIEMNSAVAPKGWTITTATGVRKIVNTQDGEHEKIVCPDVVVITARLVNEDDGKERLELSIYRNGVWKKIIAPRTQVYNRASIIELGNIFHVTSETAKELVQFLATYEITNSKTIPLKKSIARVGWLSKDEFFPFSAKEEIVFEEGVSADIHNNIKEYGNYKEWKDMMITLRKNPIARFLTSACFASPLLIKMVVRPFVIHLWGDSASGKTATLLHGRPIDDKEFASTVHKISETNYGYAGAEFMRLICVRLKSEPDFLSKLYAERYNALKTKGLKGVHAEFIAAVIVADYLAETLIFGTDEATADTESFNNGVEIFKHNEEQLQGDIIESAYRFVVEWIASNERFFVAKDSKDNPGNILTLREARRRLRCYGRSGRKNR